MLRFTAEIQSLIYLIRSLSWRLQTASIKAVCLPLYHHHHHRHDRSDGDDDDDYSHGCSIALMCALPARRRRSLQRWLRQTWASMPTIRDLHGKGSFNTMREVVEVVETFG